MNSYTKALPALGAAFALIAPQPFFLDANSAWAASSVVQELRKARLDRIKSQAFGGVSLQAIMPAAGPTIVTPPIEDEPEPSAGASEATVQRAVQPEEPIEAADEPEILDGLPIGNTAPVAAAGGPSTGTTFRRDPVEAPILDDERWQELLYAIELNGRTVSDGELVLRSPDGETLAVEVDRAREWRVRIDPDRIIELGGIPYLPITDLPNAQAVVNEATLVLQLTLPPSAFEAIVQDLQSTSQVAIIPPPHASVGGFLDYDFIAIGGETTEERLDGLVEVGAFSPLGTGLTSMAFNDVGGGDFEAIRLETTFTRDLPSQRATLRIGDSLTTGGSFANSQRFGGLQWATNFATDPNFVSFPLPTIGGLSEQQSVVEVVTDNLSSITTEVPAGPFSLGNIPVVTGAGELQVTVTDLLGREQTVTQPYYVSSQLLKPGLHDFAYELGFARDNFGEDGFDYGDPLISTTHRFGITDGLTLEGHGDADLDGGALMVGGAAQLSGFGVLSGGVGGSSDDDLGEGYLAQLSFDYQSRAFNAGMRSRYTSKDYRLTGGGSDDVEREDQANVGFSFGDFGRLGLLFLNREFHDADASRSFTGSYSMPLLGGSLVLNAAHTIEPETDTAVIAAFSMPLSRTRSIATFAERQDDEWRGRVQYRRNRDRSDLGLDYRIGADYADEDGSLDGRIGYNFTKVATSLEVEHDDDGSDLRAGMAGSLALVDGKVGLSRPLGRAFGLVDLPGYPDVQVFLDNREAGRTDGDGQLLLPSLRPYQANRVSLALNDLPLEAKVIEGDAVAVPYDRVGVRLPLAIGQGRSAVAILLDRLGEPLPAGMIMTSGDTFTTAQVARAGLTQLDGLRAVETEVTGQLGNREYRCKLDGLPLDGEPFPDLGEIVCD